MAGGLGKVGKPGEKIGDRFARADAALLETNPEADPYRLAGQGGEGARTEPPAASPSATIKKTVNLTTRTMDDMRHIDRVLMQNGRKAKETELLRAAVEFLAAQPDDAIVAAYDAVEKLQTGPRKL